MEGDSTVHRGLLLKNGGITGMGGHGLLLGPQAEVTHFRVRWNRFNAINAGDGSTVSGNTAYANRGDGIYANFGSTGSGNTPYANGLHDIEAFFGSAVQQNPVRSTGGYGLDLSSDAAYRANVITGNTIGTVNGGVNKGDNSCNGATTCL